MGSIYASNGMRGNELVGKVDPDGQVYRNDPFRGNEVVGKVDPDGQVYRHDSFKGNELVGKVEPDGQVYRHDSFKGNELVGKVDPDGQVYRHDSFKGDELVGKVEPPVLDAGAAALLLLGAEETAEPPSRLKEIAAGVAAQALTTRRAKAPPPQPKPKRTHSEEAGRLEPLGRVIGLAHADVDSVFWANDPNRAVATWLREGSSQVSPSENNQRLVDQRQVLQDTRPFIVVVGGGRDFLVEALRALTMADLVVACAEQATLDEVGIEAADATWRPGDKQLGYGFLYEIAAGQTKRGQTIAEVLASLPISTPKEVRQPSRSAKGAGLLEVGREKVELDDAKAMIAGYCFAEKDGRWDTSDVEGSGYEDGLPGVSWRRWAYRSYDCVPPAPTPDLSGVDLLVPVGLNVTQGFGTELLERLAAAGSIVGETMASVPEGATFWDLRREEIEPAGIPAKGSTSWALHRSWAILMSVPKCGVTITHKILHHKWPNLFPLIDTQTLTRLQEGAAWLNIYDDLTSQAEEFSELEEWFEDLLKEHSGSVRLSRLRLHDIILWCRATGEDAEAVLAGRDII